MPGPETQALVAKLEKATGVSVSELAVFAEDWPTLAAPGQASATISFQATRLFGLQTQSTPAPPQPSCFQRLVLVVLTDPAGLL